MYCIYKITNIKTNKIYIGQTSKTIDERFRSHIKCAKRKVNRYLYDSMNFHGYENFHIALIEIVSSKQEADDRERYWIDELSTFYPNGYNMTLGGGGGYTLSSYSEHEKQELYKRQAQKRVGRVVSNDTRKKYRRLIKVK